MAKEHKYKVKEKNIDLLDTVIEQGNINIEYTPRQILNQIDMFDNRFKQNEAQSTIYKITVDKIEEQIPKLKRIKDDMLPVYKDYIEARIGLRVLTDENKDLKEQVDHYKSELEFTAKCLKVNVDELTLKPKSNSEETKEENNS